MINKGQVAELADAVKVRYGDCALGKPTHKA